MTRRIAETITLAREARGLSQTALAQRAGVSQATISRIEHGELECSDEIAESIAAVLGFPDSLLSRHVPLARVPQTHFRRQKSVTAGCLKSIQAEISLHLLRLRQLLLSAEVPEVKISQLQDAPVDDPDFLAGEVRRLLEVPRGPIENLTELLEESGVVIIEMDFGKAKVSGLSYWDKELPPVIFIRHDLPGDRYRFTLAHELAHLILHSGFSVLERDVEREADAFASAFMMPHLDVKHEMATIKRSPGRMDHILAMKKRWGVAMQAIVQRAVSLGALRKEQVRYFYYRLAEMGYTKTREPDVVKREHPRILEELFEFHRTELGFSEKELHAITLLNAHEFAHKYGPRRKLRAV